MIYIVSMLLMSFLSFTCALNANKPFVAGELTGQLGNQLFVIAATINLALDNNAEPVFPNLATRNDDNTPLNYQKVFYHLKTSFPQGQSISSIYNEPFDYAPIPYTPNMYLRGYFQSEKYFIHHKKEVLELLAPHPEITKYLQSKYGVLLSHPMTVSVHLRSYVDHDPYQKIYPQYVGLQEKGKEIFYCVEIIR